MKHHKSSLQTALYALFLVSCLTSVALGLALIWWLEPSKLLGRVLGTAAVLAVGSALTMSATRLVTPGVPEDDRAD